MRHTAAPRAAPIPLEPARRARAAQRGIPAAPPLDLSKRAR
ncbi:MAG TPA: hypothetical protein VGB83_02125 [Actinomycetota bacterium]